MEKAQATYQLGKDFVVFYDDFLYPVALDSFDSLVEAEAHAVKLASLTDEHGLVYEYEVRVLPANEYETYHKERFCMYHGC